MNFRGRITRIAFLSENAFNVMNNLFYTFPTKRLPWRQGHNKCLFSLLTDGLNLATKHRCKYIEVSAILNHRIDELLVGIVRQIRLRPDPLEEEETILCGGSHGSHMTCLPRSAQDFLCGLMGKEQSDTRSCENLLEL